MASLIEAALIDALEHLKRIKEVRPDDGGH
jgi:hypothetical protein